ncbi:MAG: hypothetical protein FWC73_09205 [Defluviitaleaceae bacterium]|nr:hypothetical protein [Defluviitaleaceae bacterium]
MKKYAGVYPPMIERLTGENSDLKAAKRKLHQAYGAYTQDNGYKKAGKLLDNMNEGIPSTAQDLLALHASTKERLPYYKEFYEFILENTGPIESILDIGCGYNPFSVPLIPTKLKAYYAVDIDVRGAELINRFFLLLGLPPYAKCADLAVEIPQDNADIAMMCKLIPVLEAQSPGSGYRLARELNTRFLLITYPLKSLGGREKGMAKNYTAAFEKALADGQLEPFSLIAQKQIGQEMLYLASK